MVIIAKVNFPVFTKIEKALNCLSCDGLTDAQNQQGEMFGDERLLDIIRDKAPRGSRALEERLLKTIDEFTQDTPQTDDITLLIVEKCR